MDLVSDKPWWSYKNGLLGVYPPLISDQNAEILILGGGITGSLIAEALTADGHDVVMLDARDVGAGSTSASTALLQYEIDTHLIELEKQYGWEIAKFAYQSCHEAIDLLEKRIETLGLQDCHFTRKPSVYLASRKRDVPTLEQEAEARQKANLPVTIWNQEEIEKRFSFSAPLALCSDQGAEVDAYRLAHGLLRVMASRGARIFDQTRAIQVEASEKGVCVQTDRGFRIQARQVIVAMGYESETLFNTGKLVDLRSSYAIVSEPMPNLAGWWERCLLWESARPYFYLRSDTQDRVILGGEDDAFRNPLARDRLVEAKAKKLKKRFESMFPDQSLEVANSWAGTFGETKDGLAYIGPHEAYPNCFFALGFGGNGITYSMIAAEILRKQVRGIAHAYEEVYRFGR